MKTLHSPVKKENMTVKTASSEEKKEYMTWKGKQYLIQHDFDGHDYVEMRVRRGVGKNRRMEEIRIHPDLIDVKKKAYDSELITGIFKFNEREGGELSFRWALPYLDELPKPFKWIDGESITIPRALANHIKNKGKIPIHKDSKDENGKPLATIGSWKDRFDFFPTNNILDPDRSGNGRR